MNAFLMPDKNGPRMASREDCERDAMRQLAASHWSEAEWHTNKESGEVERSLTYEKGYVEPLSDHWGAGRAYEVIRNKGRIVLLTSAQQATLRCVLDGIQKNGKEFVPITSPQHTYLICFADGSSYVERER
jgi:hypothetical protein